MYPNFDIFGYRDSGMKFFSVLSAFLILFQSVNISFGEVMRFNEFMEHASFHKEQYGDTLAEFISKHYGELKAEHQKNHQEEKEEHDNLPFQNPQCTHHAVNAIVGIPSSAMREKPEGTPEKKENFFYLLCDYPGFRSGVFQPPKNA